MMELRSVFPRVLTVVVLILILFSCFKTAEHLGDTGRRQWTTHAKRSKRESFCQGLGGAGGVRPAAPRTNIAPDGGW